ncbi:hypothetical protein AGMMS49543_22180 [Betaproteobacteria bacterium]|nr:hypothetical protein AGMMS49543_22180 [Betaproteobacteria bacterium]GHU22990.1 hypothetical protein AGMMS50243_23600 [Betaproteobacteria bacterium]
MKVIKNFFEDGIEFKATSIEERRIYLRDFIDHCVSTERKRRFFGFIDNEKRINSFSDSLDHFGRYLDLSRAVNISRNTNVDSIFLKFGINKSSCVFVFSNLHGLELGVVVKIGDVLGRVFKIGNGVIISSIDLINPFFMYLGEEMCEQYLWVFNHKKT